MSARSCQGNVKLSENEVCECDFIENGKELHNVHNVKTGTYRWVPVEAKSTKKGGASE